MPGLDVKDVSFSWTQNMSAGNEQELLDEIQYLTSKPVS